MLANLLAKSEPFADLEPNLLADLAAHCGELPVGAGRLVFAHGETADAVYLVLEGTVTVFRDKVGSPLQLLARVGPGELLGELSLFDETSRSASARATTECRLVRIPRDPLLNLLRTEPRLALRIQNTAARRRNRNSQASLELGQQAEVRIRLRAHVHIRLEDERMAAAVLDNLSMGGLGLSDAPVEWGPGDAVRFTLIAEGEELPIDGRIAWRQDTSVGIAFLTTSPGHERQVYRLLRRLGE